MGGFSRRVKFIPNKYAETNISAKFNAFTRDVNVWLIFDHNYSDYKVYMKKNIEIL